MPICPNCKTEQRRRKNDACPNCEAEIEVHDGRWYLSGTGSPNLALVEAFERLVSHQQSALRDKDVQFYFPRKGTAFQHELVAARQLLKMADNDLDTATEALNLLFNDEQFSYKLRTSLTYIHKDFRLALAIVHALQKAADAATQQQARVVEATKDRAKIFSK